MVAQASEEMFCGDACVYIYSKDALGKCYSYDDKLRRRVVEFRGSTTKSVLF